LRRGRGRVVGLDEGGERGGRGIFGGGWGGREEMEMEMEMEMGMGMILFWGSFLERGEALK